jgi:hypothetical protein
VNDLDRVQVLVLILMTDRELFCAEFAALKNLRRWELEWYQQALRQLQERSGSIGRLGP